MLITSIDKENIEDCLGSITGFLCLQILSHIVVEFAWLYKKWNMIFHEIKANRFHPFKYLNPYHILPAPNALVHYVVRRKEYKQSIGYNSSKVYWKTKI